MTDRKLVLFLFFVVAFGLNALFVPVPLVESHGSIYTYSSGETKVQTPSDLAQKKLNFLKDGNVQDQTSQSEPASGEVPALVRKTFSHYRELSAINHQRELILPMMGQGPPVSIAS